MTAKKTMVDPAKEPPANREARRRKRKIPPALLRSADAAAYLSMGLSTFERYDAAGLVPAGVKCGACKVWGRRELAEWAARGCPPRAEWAPLWRQITARRAGGKA